MGWNISSAFCAASYAQARRIRIRQDAPRTNSRTLKEKKADDKGKKNLSGESLRRNLPLPKRAGG